LTEHALLSIRSVPSKLNLLSFLIIAVWIVNIC